METNGKIFVKLDINEIDDGKYSNQLESHINGVTAGIAYHQIGLGLIKLFTNVPQCNIRDFVSSLILLVMKGEMENVEDKLTIRDINPDDLSIN